MFKRRELPDPKRAAEEADETLKKLQAKHRAYQYRTELSLAGVYYARMTRDESNAWNVYWLDHPGSREILRTNFLCTKATHMGDDGCLREAVHLLNMAQRKAFQIAKAWVEEHVDDE